MNTLKRYWGLTLSASIFSTVAALAVDFCNGYQTGFPTDYDLLLDELLADIYYADNPVDCPPCDDGKRYEWFYVEPPPNNHLGEEQQPPARQEATVGPLKLGKIKPQKTVNDEND